MKQLILLLATVFAANAATANVNPKTISKHLRASGTYFENPPVKGWSNSTNSSSTVAKFADFTGSTYVALVSNGRQIDVELEYDVELREGSVDMIVVNERGQEIFRKSFSKSEKGTVIVTMEPFEEYRVRFMGRRAKGTYECRWTEL